MAVQYAFWKARGTRRVKNHTAILAHQFRRGVASPPPRHKHRRKIMYLTLVGVPGAALYQQDSQPQLHQYALYQGQSGLVAQQ